MKPRDAHRCYRYLIARLSVNDRHQRVIEVCRKIRAHGRTAGRFAFLREIEQTYTFEIEALCELGRYRPALRQLRAWQRQMPASRRMLNVFYHEAPLLI